jgi:hypothetical protein
MGSRPEWATSVFAAEGGRRTNVRTLSCQQETILEPNGLGDGIWYGGNALARMVGQVMGTSARMYENH